MAAVHESLKSELYTLQEQPSKLHRYKGCISPMYKDIKSILSPSMLYMCIYIYIYVSLSLSTYTLGHMPGAERGTCARRAVEAAALEC